MSTIDTTVALAEASAAGFDPERLALVADAIDNDVAARRYDGAALWVGRGDRVVLAEARGYADRSADRLLAEDTAFVTMSIGKQFVNALVLREVERGRLRLHQPIADLLPEFGARGKGGITLFHLLTHTSGLMSAVPPLPPEQLADNAAVAAFAANSVPEAMPGERVNYSIIVGHAILGELLLAVDGRRRSFTQLMEEELFRVLGMTDTSVGCRDDLRARLAPVRSSYAAGEEGLFTGEELEGLGAIIGIEGVEIPAGGFVSTGRDVHRFAEMLRRGGELDGCRILSPAMIEYAARNHTGEHPNSIMAYAVGMRRWTPWPASIGLGFFVRGEGVIPGPLGVLNSPRTFGGWGAGSTCFWVDPERDVSFALLTTGVMEDSRHVERSGRLSDLVVSSVVA